MFQNSKGDSISFQLDNYDPSASHKPYLFDDGECLEEITISDKNSYSRYKTFEIEYSSRPSASYLFLRILQSEFVYGKIRSDGIYSGRPSIHWELGQSPIAIDTARLGGKLFSNLQLLSIDTVSEKPEVYKTWISAEKGVVAFEKRKGKELWVIE